MATQNVFIPTGFSLAELTASINTLPHRPTLIGDSGIFEYDGVTTTSIEVEKQGSVLTLVPNSPRGTAGKPIGRRSRDLRSFVTGHLQLNDAIRADEVLNVRLFGTENQLTPLQTKIMQIMKLGMDRLDYTLEYQRAGALKGIVYDYDGTTVLYNMFTEFGVAQSTANIALSSTTTDVRTECDKYGNTLDDILGGVSYQGMTAWCGRTFWQNLVGHKSVRETYLNQSAALQLQGKTGDTLEFGGITWRKYRGKANGSDMIGATKAYVLPEGVPGMFLGRFAPGDWNDTVGTKGLPIYAKGKEDDEGKGWCIEMQSNPIHLCTRPDAVIELTAT